MNQQITQSQPVRSPDQATSNAALPLASLPQGVDVLGSGSLVDSTGTPCFLNEEILKDIAASYDPALHEAPLTVGHPADNLPAYGWVSGLNAKEGHLYMNHQQVEPQFAEMVSAGRFKKRSASIYPPQHPSNPKPGRWYLRHVAFLGAEPPAVKGLKEIQFSSSDEEGCINFTIDVQPAQPTLQPIPTTPSFSEKKGNDMADQTPAQTTPAVAPAAVPVTDAAKDTRIAELQVKVTELEGEVAKLKGDLAEAEKAKKALQEQVDKTASEKDAAEEQAIVEFAEAQIKEGKLLPADRVTTIAVMKSLRKAEPFNFTEGNTTRKVTQLQAYQDQLKTRPRIINFSEVAGGAAPQQAPVDDDELDKRAKAYQVTHPDVSYVQALEAVKNGATA